jgi:hypothetical protein
VIQHLQRQGVESVEYFDTAALGEVVKQRRRQYLAIVRESID